MKTFEIEVFKFNSKTDYLPYYRRLKLQIDLRWSVLELLEVVSQNEEFIFAKSNAFLLKINGIHLKASDLLIEVIKPNTNIIIIEPLSTYRVHHDLLINTDDFISKFVPFKKYDTTGELKNYYISKMTEYYASNTLSINKDYIGEAALYLANKIIDEMPQYKQDMINFLKNEDNGIWFHTSLDGRITNSEENSSLFVKLFELVTNKINHTTNETQNEDIEIAQTFDNFNISFYSLTNNSNISHLIELSKAKLINLESKNHDIAKHCIDTNFTHKIAGTILLEAIDKNSDFLVIEDTQDLGIFDVSQKQISCLMGRDINLPIITKQQFIKLLNGIKDKKSLGFDTHRVNISFL